MPTKKKPVASKGAGKGKRKQCSQPSASLSPAPSSDEETNQVPSDDDSVERSRPPILSKENQTEHVVSALYSNDTPIQDCNHLSMRG